MFRTAYLLLLFTAELFFWMNKTDAFTIPCEASLKTVKRVTRCPSDSITYDEAVKAKNCAAVAAEAQACSSFEYHCVLSEDYEYAVEVCAPSFFIIGGVCAMFNRYLKGILRIEGKNCKECPYNYNSTFAYQYAECYANITKYYRKEIQQRNMKDELNTPAAVLGSIVALLLLLLAIHLVYVLRWKKRKDKKSRLAINGGPRIVLEEEEILLNNGNTHTRRSEGIMFIRFSDDLAKHFPHTKLEHLKYILRASGRVKNVNSLDAAHSVVAVFSILQSENIFRKKDVIFLQFLFRLTDCQDLYDKCINYALSMKALCFFEATSEQGSVDVKFHIKGNLDDYTRQAIDDIVQEVADMLECEKRNILVNGVLHSSSFLLVLSIKETYVWKLSCMNEQDKVKLQRLNIDYLMFGEEVIALSGSKGNGKEKVKNELDAGMEFAKLCNYIARQFPQEKLQNLKDVIRGNCKLCDSTVLKNANSALECFSIVQEKQHFTMTDVSCLQILCKETNCPELFMKCSEFAIEHGSLCYCESLQERCLTSYEENEIRKIQYTIADILKCLPDDILISHPNIEDEVTYMVDDSTSLISRDFIPEELQCDHKSERFIYCGTTGSEVCVLCSCALERTLSADKPSTILKGDTIPSEKQTVLSLNDQPISSTCTKDVESDELFTSPKVYSIPGLMQRKKKEECVFMEGTLSPNETSTFDDCYFIPSEEQTAVSPNDQPISSTCTKDEKTGGISKDVEINEEGDASKHSDTAFKTMEYENYTFLVNEKCRFIVSVNKKYGDRLHDMNKHDLEKLYGCNIRSIRIE